MAFERDYSELPGEFEITYEGKLLRDCQWQLAEVPRFRAKRAPHHYQYAPTRKLLLEGRAYCLRDTLSEPGYNRSLDGTEETQRFVVFSAMDPATPIGFFSFHRRVALSGDVLELFLYPNFIYVAPPYRGLGYAIALVSGALEVWESELHHQASRHQERCVMDVRIDADTFGHAPARRIVELLAHNTREALESCESFWRCRTRKFAVVTHSK
jgi:GNAT superfamily N-acetyltransferase